MLQKVLFEQLGVLPFLHDGRLAEYRQRIDRKLHELLVDAFLDLRLELLAES
jgi:hypothetical protein